MKIILNVLLLLILLPLAHSAEARMCTCSNAAEMQPYQDCVSDAQKTNEAKCGLAARRNAVAAAENAIARRCNYQSSCVSKGMTELMNGNPKISFIDENGNQQTQTFNQIVNGVLNNPNSSQVKCFERSQDASIKQCDIDPGQVACILDSSCNNTNSRSFTQRSATPAAQPTTSGAAGFFSALMNYFTPPRTEPAVTAPAYVNAPQYVPMPTQTPPISGAAPCRPSANNTNRGGNPSGNICLYPEECRGIPNEAQCLRDFLNTHNC